MNCVRCGSPVSNDEAGLTKKLINRGITDAWCFCCLSEYFLIPVQELKEMVERFRADGCLLFARTDSKR